MAKRGRPPLDDPTVTDWQLVMRVVEAACAFRDHDWETDGFDVMQALDKAVDAWRRRLVAKGDTEPFNLSEPAK